MKSLLLTFVIYIILATSVQAQSATAQLDLKLNQSIFKPGDSLRVKVTYKADTVRKNQSLATVELIIENENGVRTRLRWPMIDGHASGTLFLPDSLLPGRYTLLAGLQQRFFEVIGQVKDARNIGTLQAMLLTKTGEWVEQEVSVSADGTFAI
ncbi:MAG: hypothetical protein ACTHMC_14015, partial [Pseudobacter sp.]|uniref:hypothetical protein n=1 Tax=Pseudobacter sp. TaxID=2045420 RepID=UPI003F81046E